MKAQTAREMEIKKRSYDEGLKAGEAMTRERAADYVKRMKNVAAVDKGKHMKVNDCIYVLELIEKNIRNMSNDE